MMNLDVERQLIEACKSNRVNKTTTLGEREHRSDVDKYLSLQRYQDELKCIFKTLPSILLHASELIETDSYQSVNTPIGSLIVSRDAGGKARVFRNACRHRGAKLVDGKGCSKRIVCPYHAWSYSTDGQLSNVPGQRHCFPQLNKQDNGLIPVPCAEKYGFIWMCPDIRNSECPDVHLDEHLGNMQSHLNWLAPQGLKVFNRSSQIWNGNWKLFSEGGLETYHFAFAHKHTIAPYFYNNTAVIDQISQHFRVVMPTKELETLSEESIRHCSHTLFFLLPNTALLIQKEHVDWLQFRPVDVDKTEITITSLVPEETDLTDPVQQNHWQKNFEITNRTLAEDWELGVSIQKAISNHALPHIQYGKNEWALQAFNEVLNTLLKGNG